MPKSIEASEQLRPEHIIYFNGEGPESQPPHLQTLIATVPSSNKWDHRLKPHIINARGASYGRYGEGSYKEADDFDPQAAVTVAIITYTTPEGYQVREIYTIRIVCSSDERRPEDSHLFPDLDPALNNGPYVSLTRFATPAVELVGTAEPTELKHEYTKLGFIAATTQALQCLQDESLLDNSTIITTAMHPNLMKAWTNHHNRSFGLQPADEFLNAIEPFQLNSAYTTIFDAWTYFFNRSAVVDLLANVPNLADNYESVFKLLQGSKIGTRSLDDPTIKKATRTIAKILLADERGHNNNGFSGSELRRLVYENAQHQPHLYAQNAQAMLEAGNRLLASMQHPL